MERKRPICAEARAKLQEERTETIARIAESWRHYLNGLWLSGLRLGESLALSWEENSGLCEDLSGKFPMLLIPAEAEKGNKDRVLPMAPEFAEWLLRTSREQRTSFVFNPLTKGGQRAGKDLTVRTVCAFGQAAGVKVRNDGRVKFASAHDLRRSIGERWASRVMPQVVKELMRHDSIDTTLRFYVGRNAESTAGVSWDAHKSVSSNNPSNSQLVADAGIQHENAHIQLPQAFIDYPRQESNL